MNKAGLLLLVPAGLALIPAAAEVPPPPRKLSEHITQEIRATLPVYTLPPATPAATVTEAPAPDPDVLVLPKLRVKEKYQQRFEANDLLSKKDLKRKFARDYKNSLQGFDAVLNGIWLPLFSPSPAARGRGMRDYQRLVDFDHLVETSKAADPKISAELKKAVIDMELADERQNRPAGGK
jgi:hypothetical protein